MSRDFDLPLGANASTVEDIPVDRINVLNPRERNAKSFQELLASIAALGLKKPISVTRQGQGDGLSYSLVCGQGRLEAFLALGQKTIPALVVEANSEEAYLRSLVENIARRSPRSLEQLELIRELHCKGYDNATIARKTALDHTWIQHVLTLLNQGEERLLAAIEAGRIPLTTAMQIAQSSDGQVQEVMQLAYESGELRGKKLLVARKVVEARRGLGKSLGARGKRQSSAPLTATMMVRAYNKEVDRQKHFIRKADLVQQRLAFVTAALGGLLNDEHFTNLLRAEGLASLPKVLDEMMRGNAP